MHIVPISPITPKHRPSRKKTKKKKNIRLLNHWQNAMTLILTQQADCPAGQHYKVDMYMDLYGAMSLLIHTGRSDMDHTVYLQTTPCLPWFPSRRASTPFGWYSFYRPTEGRRLSRPGWLVTYRNKVPPPVVEPGRSPIPVLTGISVG